MGYRPFDIWRTDGIIEDGKIMGLSAEQIQASLDVIAARDRHFKKALAMAGYPEPRLREKGYTTLLRTIVGQQVSVAAANSMWNKLIAKLGED